MNYKKVIATLLAGVMTLSLAACGSDGSANTAADTAADTTDNTAATETAEATEAPAEDTNTEKVGSGEKLVIWTLAKDLQTFAEHYVETHDAEIETVVIEPADYVTKVQTALNG